MVNDVIPRYWLESIDTKLDNNPDPRISFVYKKISGEGLTCDFGGKSRLFPEIYFHWSVEEDLLADAILSSA
jgi:hypothetical protein